MGLMLQLLVLVRVELRHLVLVQRSDRRAKAGRLLELTTGGRREWLVGVGERVHARLLQRHVAESIDGETVRPGRGRDGALTRRRARGDGEVGRQTRADGSEERLDLRVGSSLQLAEGVEGGLVRATERQIVLEVGVREPLVHLGGNERT